MRTRFPVLVLLLGAAVAGCGGTSGPTPKVLDTYGYNDGSVERVACCDSIAKQARDGSPEYSVEGVPWFDVDGVWHEGRNGVGCLVKDQRTRVRIGYFTYPVTREAPGTTVVAWVRCEQ